VGFASIPSISLWDAQNKGVRTGRKQTLAMNRKKILIVDDNRIVLKALSMKLVARGYQALTAEDGAAAFGVMRKEKARPDTAGSKFSA